MHPTRYPPGAVRCLSPDDIAAFVAEELFAAGRTQPVVALTTDPKLGRPLVDAVRVTTELRGLAEVVEIETGDATWALSDAMPPRLDVYGGAVRIWWPGLTAESGPRDHPLFFVYTDADARRVEQQVIAAVRDRDRARAGERSSPAAKAPASPVEVKVTVVSVDGDRIVVEGGGARGTVTEADLPLEVLAPCVTVGLELDARLLRPAGGSAGDGDGDSEGEGGAAFSLAGMLPNAWQRLGAEVREQDVLVGRVQNLDPQRKLVFVDVLPGAVGVCPIGELHHEFVRDMADYVEAGELLPFAVV
ncbi:MAG: hypothetical protein KAI24_24955, partial [Planctomycetes bacterium]|nr:hypothetical protein [Planctomycetota bacterium]